MWKPSKIPPKIRHHEHGLTMEQVVKKVREKDLGTVSGVPPKSQQADNPQKNQVIPHDDDDPDFQTREGPKFKEVFDWILWNVAKHLEAMNLGLENFNVHGLTKPYEEAVEAYEKFIAKVLARKPDPDPLLKVRDSDPKGAGELLHWIEVEPVMGRGGFIIGASVTVKWCGGSHSDGSAIHVP